MPFVQPVLKSLCGQNRLFYKHRIPGCYSNVSKSYFCNRKLSLWYSRLFGQPIIYLLLIVSVLLFKTMLIFLDLLWSMTFCILPLRFFFFSSFAKSFWKHSSSYSFVFFSPATVSDILTVPGHSFLAQSSCASSSGGFGSVIQAIALKHLQSNLQPHSPQ